MSIISKHTPSKIQDKCLICFKNLCQPLGKLYCLHSQFCFDCIVEWSYIANKCPLCNSRFYQVTNSVSNQTIIVQQSDQPSTTPNFQYLLLYCQVCQSLQDQANMLICDRCEKGYHTYCVGLKKVPVSQKWFCMNCRPRKRRASYKLSKPVSKRKLRKCLMTQNVIIDSG